MNRTRPLQSFAVLGAIPLLFGCTAAGGQTGEENFGCVETKTALDPAEASPLGFPAQALVDTTGSSVVAPGAWLAVAGLPYGPESGASNLTLSFGPIRAARFVKSELGAGREIALETCADRVEVVLDASATTDGGALAEHFQAVLSASASDDVSLSELFDPAQLAGQFAFDAQALGARRFTRLTLSGHWFLGGFSARLAAGIEDSAGTGPGSTVSFTNAPLACFASSAGSAPNDCTQ